MSTQKTPTKYKLLQQINHPEKQKLGGSLGNTGPKVESSLHQALRTRGERPYTRRLGKIPGVPPPRNLFD